MANLLEGVGGHDMLLGYAGHDRIEEGAAVDVLTEGAGRDTLAGGWEGATFAFPQPSDSGPRAVARDVITDFRDGMDRIDLHVLDAKPANAGADAFTFLGTNAAWTRQADELRAMWTSAGQVIQADTNGGRVAHLSGLVQDSGHSLLLSESDVLL